MSRLSIILQGNLRPESPAALRSARALYPESEIILATWRGQAPLPEFALCDRVLELEDPGPLPTETTLRNLRRQAVSTHAALAEVRTELVVKSRTDLVLRRPGLAEFARDLRPGQLAVWRNFSTTRFQHAPYHASDILQAGAVSTLREYWPAEVPDAVAACGLVPEQWLFVRYLAGQGVKLPPERELNSRSFRNLRAHARSFARYLRIIPGDFARLPPRLLQAQSHTERNFSGSLAESAAVWLALNFNDPPLHLRLLSLLRRVGLVRKAA